MFRGQVITLLTFPGVIMHELAHMLFCLWTGTRVTKVRLFRFGNPAGYVIHEHPSSAWKTILIGVGPFFVNTIVGFLIALSAFLLRGEWQHEDNRPLCGLDVAGCLRGYALLPKQRRCQGHMGHGVGQELPDHCQDSGNTDCGLHLSRSSGIHILA